MAGSYLESIVELVAAVEVDNRSAYPAVQGFDHPFYSCHAYEAVEDNPEHHHLALGAAVVILYYSDSIAVEVVGHRRVDRHCHWQLR